MLADSARKGRNPGGGSGQAFRHFPGSPASQRGAAEPEHCGRNAAGTKVSRQPKDLVRRLRIPRSRRTGGREMSPFDREAELQQQPGMSGSRLARAVDADVGREG